MTTGHPDRADSPPAPRPLFRDEALQAQGSWLGRVQLVRPLSLDILSLGVLAAAIIATVFVPPLLGVSLPWLAFVSDLLYLRVYPSRPK